MPLACPALDQDRGDPDESSLPTQPSMVRSIIRLVFSAMLCTGAIVASAVPPAHGQSTDVDATDSSSMKHTGRLHDRLRAAQAREQPSLAEEITDIYSQYVKAKDRLQKATNLQYSLDVSVMYQWGSPKAGAPAGQSFFPISKLRLP